MARFLALFASSNVTLFDPFCVIFCLLEERSMAGPWAFVLNISSNSSTFKSWGREGWNRKTGLHIKCKSGSYHLDSFLSIKELNFFYSVLVLSHGLLCSPICVTVWLMPHTQMWTSKIDNWFQPADSIGFQKLPCRGGNHGLKLPIKPASECDYWALFTQSSIKGFYAFL